SSLGERGRRAQRGGHRERACERANEQSSLGERGRRAQRGGHRERACERANEQSSLGERGRRAQRGGHVSGGAQSVAEAWRGLRTAVRPAALATARGELPVASGVARYRMLGMAGALLLAACGRFAGAYPQPLKAFALSRALSITE